MYTMWLFINYIIAFAIIFFIIKNIILGFNGGEFLLKSVMAAIYVLAIVIVFDAAKFAHMGSLYPNEYAAAGLSSKEIIIRDIASIVLILIANFIKRLIDKRADEEIKENQKDERTQKWKRFLDK